MNGRPVIDLFYDQPASAHAVGGVSTNNNSCSGSGKIHQTSRCNTTFKYDQDGDGAALTAGDGCYGAYGAFYGDPSGGCTGCYGVRLGVR